MANETSNTEANENIYTATFTLIQTGLSGEVTPKLEFSPLVDPTSDEAPAVYEYMAGVALQFLRTVNAIDDNLNPMNEEEWDRVQLTLSAGEDGKVN